MLDFLLLIPYFPLEKIFYYPSHYIFIPILSILILPKIKFNKKNFFSYELYFFLFFVFSTFRSCFSKHIEESITLIIGFIIAILYYLYVWYYLEKFSIKEIETKMKITTFIFLILNVITAITNYGRLDDRGVIRIIGLFTDPNLFCLAIIIPIGYYISNKKKVFEKILFYLAIILFFKTFSRGGFIGLIILLFITILQKKKNIKFYLIHIFFFFLLLTSIYFFREQLMEIINFDKIYSRVTDLNISSTSINSLGSGRIRLWIYGLELLKDNFWFGVGMNNIPLYLFELKNDYHYLHNTFLEILVENGILGSFFYFLFFIKFIFHKSYNKQAQRIKNIIYAQIVMCIFLTALLSIQVFFTFALYKYYNMNLNGGKSED